MQNTFSQFALLGSGRLARHLGFYLKSLNLPLVQWSRNGASEFNSFTDPDPGTRLARTLSEASHIFLALSDRALPEFGTVGGAHKVHVHFSGTAQVAGVAAAHPLMTFGERLESPEWYRRIPFVFDAGADFANLLPGVPNPHYALPASERPLYHALCALAGNSAFLLWRQIGDEFERSLDLPRELLAPFLHQVVANSGHPSAANFTGPVAREDWPTVSAHLHALDERKSLRDAYRSYLNSAKHTGMNIPEDFL